MTIFNHTRSGLHYFLDGFHLIFQPGLKRFVFIPLMINMFCFIGLFFLAYHYWHFFHLWLLYHLPVWLHWLSFLIWSFFFLSFFIFFISTFTLLANLMTAPFNSFLAEKVEWRLTGRRPLRSSFFDNAADIPRVLSRQLSLLAYYLPRAIFLFILFFVPIVQLIAALLWFLFHAEFMTLTYVDYQTDNHRIPLKEVRHCLRQKRCLSFSFGALVLFASMLPIINLLAVPAAVAGATKLWLQAFSALTKSNGR